MIKKVIILEDHHGKELFRKKLTSLPLREKIVIGKSIEFYNDPEPCMIHRSAVMQRFYMQIDNVLDELLINGVDEVLWESIPERIKSYLDFNNNIHYVKIIPQL